MVTLNEKIEGKFRFLPGGVIELAFPVPGKGFTTSEIKYRLKGEKNDVLELKFGKEWTKYLKAE